MYSPLWVSMQVQELVSSGMDVNSKVHEPHTKKKKEEGCKRLGWLERILIYKYIKTYTIHMKHDICGGGNNSECIIVSSGPMQRQQQQ